MTLAEIKTLLSGEQYDFLRTNPHLGNNIVLLTLGGSYAYGTNIESSDVDIRGCALNSPTDLLGLTSFEQVVETKTDTTIYSFNKLVGLLLNCNPNVIELLGCKPEHYLVLTDTGQKLLDNRKLFLSKRAVNSFGGYAVQQLRRLENALARDRLPQAQTEEHIRMSMESAMSSFSERYGSFTHGAIRLYTDVSPNEDLDREIFADIQLAKFPAREFGGMLGELSEVLRSYKKLNHRNHKKDYAHLNKHAMHLIRLYLTCLDILERGEIVTCREKEHGLLMGIRNGEFQMKDGTYRPEFFDMVREYERKLEYAREHTVLPERPDMKKIQELVMEVNRSCLR